MSGLCGGVGPKCTKAIRILWSNNKTSSNKTKQSMGKRISTKEIVVRMLLDKGVGTWSYGYELQGKHTQWGFSGVDADTRAHELVRKGYYETPNNRYYIEHRKVGRYAQFRIGRTEKVESVLQWFESLPVGALTAN